MKLEATLQLYAAAAGGQSTGSSLVNTPGRVTDTPKVRDIARRRLVKMNPDVDAGTPQTDSAAFVGKKYTLQSTPPYGYGHYIKETDSTDEANLAQETRPGTRILKGPDMQQSKEARKASRRKAAKVNPDVLS